VELKWRRIHVKDIVTLQEVASEGLHPTLLS
jgi:hypothetical protein